MCGAELIFPCVWEWNVIVLLNHSPKGIQNDLVTYPNLKRCHYSSSCKDKLLAFESSLTSPNGPGTHFSSPTHLSSSWNELMFSALPSFASGSLLVDSLHSKCHDSVSTPLPPPPAMLGSGLTSDLTLTNKAYLTPPPLPQVWITSLSYVVI